MLRLQPYFFICPCQRLARGRVEMFSTFFFVLVMQQAHGLVHLIAKAPHEIGRRLMVLCGQKIQFMGAPVGKFHEQRQLAIVVAGKRDAHILAPNLDRVCGIGWRRALRRNHRPAENQGGANGQCGRHRAERWCEDAAA
jgi:hypothetical protein